ncbi:unnamed protein product [Absidia cylindrospora]
MAVVKASSNTFLIVTLATAFSIALYVCPRRRRLTAKFTNNAQQKYEQQIVDEDESALLTTHTNYVMVNQHELRIIEIPHHDRTVPLMVFIHGLGGQAAQWEHQLKHFSESYHVLAVDLVGCGYSEVVSEWSCYTASSLAEDVVQLITADDRYPVSRPLIMVSHSYGCSVATFACASDWIKHRLIGLVMISPKADLDKDQSKGQTFLPWIPDFMIDNARTKDRQGGLYSNSVERLLDADASDELRKSQLRWNLMSRTDVYKRMATGASFPTPEIYDKLTGTNILLIGGQEDKITPPSEMDIIKSRLPGMKSAPHVIPGVGHMSLVAKPHVVNDLIDVFLTTLKK